MARGHQAFRHDGLQVEINKHVTNSSPRCSARAIDKFLAVDRCENQSSAKSGAPFHFQPSLKCELRHISQQICLQ
jgi:hypothetical protein